MSIMTNALTVCILGWMLILAPSTLISDGTIHDTFPAVTASLVEGSSVSSLTTHDPLVPPLPAPPPIEVAALPLE